MRAGPRKLGAHHPAIGHQFHPRPDDKVSIRVGGVQRGLSAVLRGRSGSLGRFSQFCHLGGCFGLCRRGRCRGSRRRLFKSSLVQRHQPLQESAGLHRRVVDGLEALAQFGQQARDGLIEAVRFLARKVWLRRPQQHRDQRQVTAGVIVLAIVTAHHLRQRHHVSPGARRKIQHVRRHFVHIGQFADIGCDLLSQQFALLGLQFGFLFGLLMGLDLLFLGVPGRLQRLEHGVEGPGVLDFMGGQVAHRLRHQPHEATETRLRLCSECQAALRQLVQQAACRVIAVGKKPSVVVHQLLERGLQALDRLLHGRQQAGVLRDVGHHAPHHLHRHGGGLGCSLHGHGGIDHRCHTRPPPAGQRHGQGPGLADRAAPGQSAHQPLQLGHVFNRFGGCA